MSRTSPTPERNAPETPLPRKRQRFATHSPLPPSSPTSGPSLLSRNTAGAKRQSPLDLATQPPRPDEEDEEDEDSGLLRLNASGELVVPGSSPLRGVATRQYGDDDALASQVDPDEDELGISDDLLSQPDFVDDYEEEGTGRDEAGDIQTQASQEEIDELAGSQE